MSVSIEEISKSTVQLFNEKATDDYSAIGSGVLIEIDGNHFMITASHVHDLYGELIVLLQNHDAEQGIQPLILGGDMHFLDMSSEGSTEYKIDLAIMKLADSIIPLLKKNFTFITTDDFFYYEYKESDYLIYGYPSTRTTKKWKSNDIRIKPFAYKSYLDIRFNYERFGLSFLSHIAVQFTGNVVSESNSNPHYAPKLNGISGCGAWVFSKDSSNSNQQFNLIGIVTERIHELNDKAIIATRLIVALDYIKRKLSLTNA